MDAITLLRNDHKAVEKLFKEFEKTGERAHSARKHLADEIIRELAVHAALEEEVFYPAVRANVPDQEAHALESIEEHHIVKWLLSEIDSRDPSDERFVPKMTVLIELVRHHAEEEETDMFPPVREAMGRKQLAEIGETMEKAKRVVPTRPHPRSPDVPPGNILVGTVAGAIDRARQAVGDRMHD